MMTGPGPEPGLGELSMIRRAGLAGRATDFAGALAASLALPLAGDADFAEDFFAVATLAAARLGAAAAALAVGFVVDFFCSFFATATPRSFRPKTPGKRAVAQRAPEIGHRTVTLIPTGVHVKHLRVGSCVGPWLFLGKSTRASGRAGGAGRDD
jgi:hypothetical protein